MVDAMFRKQIIHMYFVVSAYLFLMKPFYLISCVQYVAVLTNYLLQNN